MSRLKEGTVGSWEGFPLQTQEARIPVFEAHLPTADQVLPYLQAIDASATYSNYGPLVLSLHDGLSRLIPATNASLVSASTGTAALMAGILAHAGWARPDRKLAICPAYTFVATALAVRQCGYEAYLADVSADDWMLDPEALADHPRLDEVGLVVPVCAYGRTVDTARWLAFQQKTGVPVVIDAAAAFEALVDGRLAVVENVPLAFSFHATKAFGCGEGGALVTGNAQLTRKAAQAANFGFMNSRNSAVPGFNGKMSEYHAAVALAELDHWAAKRSRFAAVHASYTSIADELGLDRRDLITAPTIASNYILYRCADAEAAASLQLDLTLSAIDTRFWYETGLAGHLALDTCPRDALPVTQEIACTLLGLPVSTVMSEANVRAVLQVVRRSQPASAPAARHRRQAN